MNVIHTNQNFWAKICDETDFYYISKLIFGKTVDKISRTKNPCFTFDFDQKSVCLFPITIMLGYKKGKT